MCRIRRVPALLDKFFDPLRSHVHWHPWMDVRLLVVAMACMWGRRHVAHRYRDLDAEPHRTRFNNFVLVARWDPEAALRPKAQAWRRALRPGPGATLDWSLEDAKKATRGQAMAASATRQDPTTAAASRGHPEVGALLVCRDHVLPVGIRLEVTQEPCAALGRPVRTTPELAAQLIREVKPPTGGTVVVVCDACSLCPTSVQTCRAQPGPLASTLQRTRRLFQHGWKLHAGRAGRQRCRRRRTDTLDRAKPDGPVRSRGVEAGGLEVSSLGPRHVVCSRTGQAP
jgi:hypothetical protein